MNSQVIIVSQDCVEDDATVKAMSAYATTLWSPLGPWSMVALEREEEPRNGVGPLSKAIARLRGFRMPFQKLS